MKKNSEVIYDYAVVGAGINGTAIAYFLTQEGKKIALIDKEGIASGGSGAAGAFISPKFTKQSPLRSLLERAYIFSLEFYHDNFSELIKSSSLCHISTDVTQNYKIEDFKKTSQLKWSEVSSTIERQLQKETANYAKVFIENAAVVNAKGMCDALAKGSDFYHDRIDKIVKTEDFFVLNSIKAKKIIMATGAYEALVQEPYVSNRGIWGHRVDITTSTELSFSIHQEVSISKSKRNGDTQNSMLSIGATHDIHFHPDSGETYNYTKGREELLDKARKSIALHDVTIVKDYVGLRSGSNDTMPHLGRFVDSEATFKKYPNMVNGLKVNSENFVYHDNIYTLNGVGGYGFVLAPYSAKILCDMLLKNKRLDDTLDVKRFFLRWVKKDGKKYFLKSKQKINNESGI